MTRDAGFKRVVRRHAAQTGQRYTEALTDLQGLGSRMDHEPAADRLHDEVLGPLGATWPDRVHSQPHYGIRARFPPR